MREGIFNEHGRRVIAQKGLVMLTVIGARSSAAVILHSFIDLSGAVPFYNRQVSACLID